MRCIIKRNSGICDGGLSQYFGLGSETRKTITYVPDPYGIEVCNPTEVPPGYEERWLLNLHAIDTRGAEDRLGCTECRCDLYNVSKDEHDQDIEPDYIGGLRCCYDETRCRVKEGFQGSRRSLYLKYTVKYIDWDSSIVPVKIYILDITDTWKKTEKSSHCGMTSLPVTSKYCHSDDMHAFAASFGLRGEALSSTSDVSWLEIVTKTHGRPSGYRRQVFVLWN